MSRNSAKSADLGNIAPSGIGGPKGGTSRERDTAKLQGKPNVPFNIKIRFHINNDLILYQIFQ